MKTSETKGPRLLWARSLLNGLYAWVLGFVLYMIPGLIMAVRMGIRLGPGAAEPAEVSARISSEVSAMYAESLSLSLAYIIFVCLLVFLRARSLNEKFERRDMRNGLLVALVPVLVSLIFIFTTGFDLLALAEIVLFTAAGYLGGTVKRIPEKVKPPKRKE